MGPGTGTHSFPGPLTLESFEKEATEIAEAFQVMAGEGAPALQGMGESNHGGAVPSPRMKPGQFSKLCVLSLFSAFL